MQQGAIAGGVSKQEFNYSTFLPDGTINFDASQVMFEIAWQKPEDYDINTGLADPYSRTSANSGGQRQPLQSRIYTATRVVNEFKQGKFEQTIEGRLYTFIKPDATNKAASAPVPIYSGADLDDASYQPTAAGPPATNQTTETGLRTGVNLSNSIAGAGRGMMPASAYSTPLDQLSAIDKAGLNPVAPAAVNPDQGFKIPGLGGLGIKVPKFVKDIPFIRQLMNRDP